MSLPVFPDARKHRLLSPDEGDCLKEECGLFGIFGHEDSAALTALGLHALQHRGQEAAGIVVCDGARFTSERHLGLVGDNFSSAETIDRLHGHKAIGHVRYSTHGETILRNVQPLFAELDGGGIAICHNGHFTNAMTLRRRLIQDGAICQSTSDSEIVLHLIARSRQTKIVDRFIDAIGQMEGGFALIALTAKKLIGARDPLGIRPLVLGDLNGTPIFASETCALDMIGSRFIREVENGEVVVCADSKMTSFFPFPRKKPRPCVFESIYFARPDSLIGGQSVYEVRKNMGYELAKESKIDGDVVVPIPDSGVPAAIGYSQMSGIPFELGIIRNHYVGRTFIEPTQSIRTLGVKLKHSANSSQIRDKRIILIDDSLVRGTTALKIVKMLREVGAREVHFCLACPPIRYPDYYGIDTPSSNNLLAARYTHEQMQDYISVDSLTFLSIDGLYAALGFEKRDPDCPQLTDHCFTGEYPTPLTDIEESVSLPLFPRLVEGK